jgi:1-aminocyclopropane-1-carboxylate deaminase/D-cysteine desulfhydrase-like pyridoxal-dependent ACC family enzyme
MIDPVDFYAKSSPARIQKIRISESVKAKNELYILREDELHPKLSGNKWRKLKYHFLKAKKTGKSIMAIGGPYSNLLHALAAGGELFGIKTTGILKGPSPARLTPTLKECEGMGMELIFVEREKFKLIPEDPKFASRLNKNPLWVPMGANDPLGLKGTSEILRDIREEFDYYICPVGTGNTLSGIVSSLPSSSIALGIAVLPPKIIELKIDVRKTNWELINGFDFGGFAKVNSRLISFIKDFEKEHGIPLDPVYTGKMAFASFELLRSRYFKKGKKILMIHSGGLQGRSGFPKYFPKV